MKADVTYEQVDYLRDNLECDCGAELQTMSHIFGKYEKRKFSGTLQKLHSVSDKAIPCLNDLDIDIQLKQRITTTSPL